MTKHIAISRATSETGVRVDPETTHEPPSLLYTVALCHATARLRFWTRIVLPNCVRGVAKTLLRYARGPETTGW